MPSEPRYGFDPIAPVQLRVLGRPLPQQRVRQMLEARELVVGLIRDRLRRQYPTFSTRSINLKLLEELARELPAFTRD